MIAALLGIIAILVGLFIWQMRSRYSQPLDPLGATKAEIADLLAQLKGRVDALVAEKDLRTRDAVQSHEASEKIINQWNERISSIESRLKQISDDATTKVQDLASQLKPIASIFRTPQAAGIEFGEAELEMLLKTHLGEGLFLRKPRLLAVGQDVVDFAIKLPDCLVPIDSKFPSVQYRAWVDSGSESEARTAWRAFRDQLLRHMETAAKYIKPDAGTTDYALIFLPSDVIYQQAFLTQRVHEQDNPIPQRAIQLQVFGCSPQTLLPMFSLIRLGLRNLKIAEDVKGIRSQIDELNNVFTKVFDEGEWKVLCGHIKQLTEHFNRMNQEKSGLSRVRHAIRQLTDLSHEHDRPVTPNAPAQEPAPALAWQKEDE